MSALTDALAGSHEPVSRLQALAPGGAVLRTWEGGTARTARLTGGTVTDDRNKVGRHDGSFTLANEDGSLSPQDLDDLFSPGALVRLERGAMLAGAPEYVTLATLGVRSYRASMMGGLTVTADSVLAALSQPMGEDLVLAAGTPAADVIRTLCAAVLEPLIGATSTWALDDDGRALGAALVILEDQDRLEVAVRTMSALGLEVYEDRFGIPVLRRIPDPTTLPVTRAYTTTAGSARLLGLTRSSESLPYNVSIVIGEPEGKDTVRAVETVTDATSPLHESRIGRRVAPILRSASIPDQAAATAVARSRLEAYALLVDAIEIVLPPDPTMEAGEVIDTTETISGTAGRYLIDRVAHPVVTGPMPVSATRVRAVVA